MKEREAIRVKKEAGKDKPWTDDEILQRYRFCNVHREDDRVTKWITEHWRDPFATNPDVWFLMSAARWVNWPDSLQELEPALIEGKRLKFEPKVFQKILKSRAERGEKVWTGAYMIGTQGNAMDKPKFIAEQVLWPLWKLRETLRPRRGDTLQKFAERVVSVKNQGRFMVAQMIADAKYATPHLVEAVDWATFALSGPGSRRGLNRVFGHPVDQGWNENEWFASLMILRDKMGLDEHLHNQDLQNCLCEFDKYERVRLNEGTPRSRYNGQ